MRKLTGLMVMLLLAVAGNAAGSDKLLTVTITGLGRVASNPTGIDCTFSGGGYSGVCSHFFETNASVALYAEGVEVEEGYFSMPCGWNGSGGFGEPPALAVAMGAAQSVEANFCYLGPPTFALPPPDGQNVYGPYLPAPDPVITPEPMDMKPMAVEETADGSLQLSVGLPNYFGPESSGVDVYVGLKISGLSGMWLFTPGGLQPVSSGLPWKTNHTSEIKKELLLELTEAQQTLLPEGIYNLYVMVTPTGTTAAWDMWITYFNIQHFSLNLFP